MLKCLDENVEAHYNSGECFPAGGASTRSADILSAIFRPITETQNRRQHAGSPLFSFPFSLFEFRLSNRDTQTIRNRHNSKKTIITGHF
jgi:hypothetical protein